MTTERLFEQFIRLGLTKSRNIKALRIGQSEARHTRQVLAALRRMDSGLRKPEPIYVFTEVGCPVRVFPTEAGWVWQESFREEGSNMIKWIQTSSRNAYDRI